MFISKLVSKLVGEKAAWRSYKARTKRLPPPYRTAIDALERYLMYTGGLGDGTAMFSDLVELFEQSAARKTPIRELLGEDPVEFVDGFVRNYPKGDWLVRERDRLVEAIARATEEEDAASRA